MSYKCSSFTPPKNEGKVSGTIFRGVLAEKWTPNQKTRLHSWHFQGQERRRCLGFGGEVKIFLDGPFIIYLTTFGARCLFQSYIYIHGYIMYILHLHDTIIVYLHMQNILIIYILVIRHEAM